MDNDEQISLTEETVVTKKISIVDQLKEKVPMVIIIAIITVLGVGSLAAVLIIGITKGKIIKSGFIHENELINLEYSYSVDSKEYIGNKYTLVPYHFEEIEFPKEIVSYHQVKKYSKLFDIVNQLKKNNSIEIFYHKKIPNISFIEKRFSLKEYLKQVAILVLKIMIVLHLISIFFEMNK
eukprot:gene6386-10393_t